MTATLDNVRDYLKDAAGKTNLVTYAELYNHFGYRTGMPNDANPIPMFLGILMTENTKHNLPLLPSIVLCKQKDKPKDLLVPNKTYFKRLGEIKGVTPPKGIKEKRALHKKEVAAVFAHYAKA